MVKFFCPNCNVELIKIPLKKTKCKKCGDYIYIKRRPGETEKKIVSENESKKIDEEWNIYYLNIAKEGFISKMEIDENEFLKRYDILKSKFGINPSLNDIEWMILNEKILNTKDYQDLKIIYDRMAYIICEEGKNPYELLKQARLFELYNFKKTEIKNVQIRCIEINCEFYKEINNKIYNIDEAIKLMPIPKKECTSGKFKNCNAMWLGYFED